MQRIQKWVIFTLISFIIIAIVLRLIKLYEFALWGSDSGEHYYILTRLINTGEIETDYNGWGIAYPYFQGMHLFSAGFGEIGGLSSFQALLFLIPITGALSVILIFCISVRVFRDPRIGLVAAGFIAVVLPHVYSSSHPMPGTLGGFILLLCIFLLLKTYDNFKFIVPLCLATLVLVVTHHMTTYFLIISIIAIILMREILQHPKDNMRTKIELGYLTFLITVTMPYWLFYAVPFLEHILSRGLPFPTWGIIALAYFGIGILWLFIYYRRKFKWQYKPKFYSAKKLIVQVILFQIFGILIIGISTVTGVPGTNMQTDFMAVPLFVPIIVFMSFMAAAPAICEHHKDGLNIVAWMGAILLSLMFAFITSSRELLLYRHLPYIFEPITILAGVGLVKLFDMLVSKKDSHMIYEEKNGQLIGPPVNSIHKPTSTISRASWPARLTAVSFVATLIVICGIFSYPTLGVVSGFEEGTTEDEFDSCLWAREHLGNDATVASDHRMSSMIFGFAEVNSSWEFTSDTLHGESLSEIEDELRNTKVPAGEKSIDYVLITEAIKAGVALEQWETAQPMTEAAIEKFDSKPFIKIYDNGATQFYFVDL